MTKEEILEQYPDREFMFADGLDDAIIGIDEDRFGKSNGRVIYSVKKCIEEFIKQGMTEEEAEESFEYNTAGAYVGEKTPIWCYDNF